jgi:hypothetical protein
VNEKIKEVVEVAVDTADRIRRYLKSAPYAAPELRVYDKLEEMAELHCRTLAVLVKHLEAADGR